MLRCVTARRRLVVLAVLVLVAGVVGVASVTASSVRQTTPKHATIAVPKKKIGLLLLAGASYAQGQIASEFKRAATTLGWDIIVRDTQGDPAKQAAGAQAFLQEKVDALVGVGVPEEPILPTLKQLKAKGIPFINAGGTITDGAKVVSAQFRGPEGVSGAIMAQFIVDTNPPGTKIAMQNFDANFGVKVRDDVVAATFKDYGMQVVATHQMDIANLVSDTLSSTKDQLAANPDLGVIYSSIDSQLPPIISLLKQLKKTNVKVYAFNADPPNTKAMRGYPNAWVVDTPWWYTAWLTSDALLRYWAQKQPLSTANQNYKYPMPLTVTSGKDVPKNLSSSAFPDLGAKLWAKWKADGFAVGKLAAPSVTVTK